MFELHLTFRWANHPYGIYMYWTHFEIVQRKHTDDLTYPKNNRWIKLSEKVNPQTCSSYILKRLRNWIGFGDVFFYFVLFFILNIMDSKKYQDFHSLRKQEHSLNTNSVIPVFLPLLNYKTLVLCPHKGLPTVGKGKNECKPHAAEQRPVRLAWSGAMKSLPRFKVSGITWGKLI